MAHQKCGCDGALRVVAVDHRRQPEDVQDQSPLVVHDHLVDAPFQLISGLLDGDDGRLHHNSVLQRQVGQAYEHRRQVAHLGLGGRVANPCLEVHDDSVGEVRRHKDDVFGLECELVPRGRHVGVVVIGSLQGVNLDETLVRLPQHLSLEVVTNVFPDLGRYDGLPWPGRGLGVLDLVHAFSAQDELPPSEDSTDHVTRGPAATDAGMELELDAVHLGMCCDDVVEDRRASDGPPAGVFQGQRHSLEILVLDVLLFLDGLRIVGGKMNLPHPLLLVNLEHHEQGVSGKLYAVSAPALEFRHHLGVDRINVSAKGLSAVNTSLVQLLGELREATDVNEQDSSDEIAVARLLAQNAICESVAAAGYVATYYVWNEDSVTADVDLNGVGGHHLHGQHGIHGGLFEAFPNLGVALGRAGALDLQQPS
mmetsp:Transcript_7474/g.13521  ORF Transcript_7474/g.13521 Transcript_7474/m.13521 type:complete len:423 (-) Transcript_7474:1384-2652(-)